MTAQYLGILLPQCCRYGNRGWKDWTIFHCLRNGRARAWTLAPVSYAVLPVPAWPERTLREPHCRCMPNHLQLSGVKQQLFYFAQGFCGSGIQKGHYRGGLCLLREVWGSGGKAWRLEVTETAGVAGIWRLPHQSGGWCWLSAGASAGASAGTRTWFLHVDFPDVLVPKVNA